jgi:hypothetical protein
MKLLSVNLARSIWLGPMSDLNPRGINLASVLIPFLISTYKFKRFPSLQDVTDPSKEWKFQDGEYKVDNDSPIKIELTIHSDGVVADTRSSTVNSDAFLEEAWTKFSELFKMPSHQSILKRRLYISQVFVNTDKDLQLLNPKLSPICEYLSGEHQNRVFRLGGISFWPDQTVKFNPISFTFERTINVPFSENRYYSAAPLQTDQHLDLLDKLEGILG